MTSLVELLKKQVAEEKRYFSNPERYAGKIKAVALKELASPSVYLFGSAVKGKATPGSDIDLLIVSESVPKRQMDRAKIKAKLYKKIGFYSPFEIHLVTPKEYSWYQRFIDKKIYV